jgi:hypothetical protein
MSIDDDPFSDISKLAIPPNAEIRARARTPAKILNRRKNFIQMPTWWWERLGDCHSVYAYRVALFLLHLNWRNNRRPFKLPNGMLKCDGVSRQSKWVALRLLERLGLITVESRPRKSPIIHVHLDPS